MHLLLTKGKANMNKSERGNKDSAKIVSPRRLDSFDSAGYTHTFVKVVKQP